MPPDRMKYLLFIIVFLLTLSSLPLALVTAFETPAIPESARQSLLPDCQLMPDSLSRVAVVAVHRLQIRGYRVEIPPRRDSPAVSSTQSGSAASQAAKSDRST